MGGEPPGGLGLFTVGVGTVKVVVYGWVVLSVNMSVLA